MKHPFKANLRLLVIAAIICVVGFAMGGQLTESSIRPFGENGPILTSLFHFSSSSDEASEKMTPAQEIHSLDFSFGLCEVNIIEGDSFDLNIRGDNNSYTSKVTDGVWKVSLDNNQTAHCTIDITIPEGAVFEQVAIEMGAGSLTCPASFQCDNINLKVGAGTMNFSEVTAAQSSTIDVGMGTLTLVGGLENEVTLSTGMGKVQLHLEEPDDYGYLIDCGMGSVSVDSDTFTGVGQNAKHNTDAPTVFNISCGMGTVNISF